MTVDLLGPASAANTVTVRPAETRVFGPDDTFLKACTPGVPGTGTPIQAAFLNALLAQLRRAIRVEGVAEDNADDDMLSKAIRRAAVLAGSGDADWYTDSGGAGASVLTQIGPLPAPISYYDGLRVRFVPAGTNAGPATVDVAGLGAVNVLMVGGAQALPGVLAAGKPVELVYLGGSFYVMPSAALEALSLRSFLGAVVTLPSLATGVVTYPDFSGGTINDQLSSYGGTGWVTSTGTLTIGSDDAGIWVVQANCGNTLQCPNYVRIEQNGAAVSEMGMQSNAGSGLAGYCAASAVLDCAAGDQLRMAVWQNSGGPAIETCRIHFVRVQ